MAGIKPVEYKNDSIVSGFAVAGDEKEINQANAKNIDKDNNAGNLQPLDEKQESTISNFVENDTTNYESDDTESVDNSDNNKNDKTGKGVAIAASATNTAALAFGAAMLAKTGKLSGLMNSFTAPVVGGVDLAVAGASLATVLTFDSDYSKRITEASNAETQINQINEYFNSINEDIEALNQDSIEYSEFDLENLIQNNEENEAEKMTAFDVLSNLYKQLEQYKKEGNQAKVDELTSKIGQFEAAIFSKLQATSEESSDVEETSGDIAEGEQKQEKVDSLVSRLNSNNANAHSITEESSSVSDFLKEGKIFGAVGIANSIALAGCAAVSTMLAVRAFVGVNIFTMGNAIAGAAMCGTAAGLFTASAATMAARSAQEIKASNKGQDIQSSINQMKPQLANHDKIIETIAQNNNETNDTQSIAQASPVGPSNTIQNSGPSTSTTSSTASGGSASSGTPS